MIPPRLWVTRGPLLGLALALMAGLYLPRAQAAKKTGPPPAIAFLMPSGGKAGSTFPCTVGGTFTKTATEVWTDHPGLVFKATAKPGIFEVTLAPDTPLGPHLVRFYTGQGASPPRTFVVGAMDELNEVEPNDDLHHPQSITKLPVTINGRFEKAGDVDTFSVHLEAGHWLAADLQGYALGSQMDPAMKLLDESGVELAMSHDTFNLDPFLAYEVKKTGAYLIQIMSFVHPPAADVTLKGSDAHVYRLTLSDQPYARTCTPCAVQRADPTAVRPLGPNYGAEASGMKAAPPEPARSETTHLLTANGEQVLLAVVNSPVITAKAPEDSVLRAQRIPFPCTVSGVLPTPKAEARFAFPATRNTRYELRVHAFSLHSPLDSYLQIEDKAGKVLLQADDNGEGVFDPSVGWNAPADGDYIAVVRDLFGRGGWDFTYALEVDSPQPLLSAALDANAYKIEPGKTTELKLTAKVTGSFKGKLMAHAEGLPSGIKMEDAEIPLKGGEMKLTLTAQPDAAPANQPFEITLSTSAPDPPMQWKAMFDLRGVEPRGDRLINEDSHVWLTVASAAKP